MLSPLGSTGGNGANPQGLLRHLSGPTDLVCLMILGLAAAFAISAPLIAPYDPAAISVTDRLQPPSLSGPHFLGTDHLGRDIASRLLFGARASISVGVSVVLLSVCFGVVLGMMGGYLGWGGEILMRVVDGMLAFPEIILALALIAALGSSVGNVILALAFVFTPRVARVVHANVLSMRSREFIVTTEALGCSQFRIAARHLFPQSIGLLSVQATFIFAYAVISEASLSFLGVGLPPGSASWGSMLSDGRNYLLDAPWITTAPGLAIFVLVLCLSLLGDRLRDIADPRQPNLSASRLKHRIHW